MPALAAILVGCVVSWASGGSLAQLRKSSVPRPFFIGIIFVLQGIARGRVGTDGWGDWGMLVWAVLAVALVAAILVEWPEPEPLIAALGISLNLLVVLANGYMPVLVRSSIASEQTTAATSSFYSVGNGAGILAPLADVVQLPLWGATYVLSVGDVLLMVAIASLMVRLSTSAPQPAAP